MLTSAAAIASDGTSRPPLTRGAPHATFLGREHVGPTPAGAGSTQLRHGRRSGKWPCPCSRGEHDHDPILRRLFNGLPPPARGAPPLTARLRRDRGPWPPSSRTGDLEGPESGNWRGLRTGQLFGTPRATELLVEKRRSSRRRRPDSRTSAWLVDLAHRPGIHNVDAHVHEVDDIARRYRHAARIRDGSDLGIGLRHRTASSSPGRDERRIGARSGTVKGEDPMARAQGASIPTRRSCPRRTSSPTQNAAVHASARVAATTVPHRRAVRIVRESKPRGPKVPHQPPQQFGGSAGLPPPSSDHDWRHERAIASSLAHQGSEW